MTATNTKALVRAILESLREDIDDEASWAAIRDLALDGELDGVRTSQCYDMGEQFRATVGVYPNKPWVVLALCEYTAGKAKSRIQYVQTYDKYSEPGYDLPQSGIVAVGNWNPVDDYDRDAQVRVPHDDTPELLGDLLDKLGCALEWSDEWTSCSDCGGLVRIQPDCHSWIPYYTHPEHGGDLVCHECQPPDQPAEPEDPAELQEGDYVTNDYVTFHVVGEKKRVNVGEDEDWREVVRADMEETGVYPDVWFESDHGNLTLLTV